ncbi:hypothetical protein ACPWSR_05405 [Alloiococcus sp. CFN-8]|uniref:hypothetical protein n=1 Tax=Alloiococcus sp. CFN-8 TaxID=3416081 RepID=UPI003CE93E49
MRKFIKLLLFIIPFVLLSLQNNTEDLKEINQESIPVSLSLKPNIEPKETEDTMALRGERFEDIESLRRLKGLDITSERLISALNASPPVRESITTQTINREGILEHRMELILFNPSMDLSAPYSCEATLYKYQSKLLAAKLSQLLPLQSIKASAFTEVRESFFNSFLGEDTTELHEAINQKLALSSVYKVTNNSSQDYCFVYGNYVVDLSLSFDNAEEDSILVKIYISQNQ